MRLLIWTEGFWPRIGGVEVYLKQFVKAIQKLGYEVAVITPQIEDYKEEETVEGAQVYRLPFYDVLFGKDLDSFLALRKRVEKIKNDFKPDLIHVILFGPSVMLHIETNKRAPVPSVVAIHSDLTRTDGLGKIAHRTLDQANEVVSVSAATLSDIQSMFPQICGKSSYIHNGLVTDGINPTPLPEDKSEMLCIGRLVDLKGFDLALEALAKVRKEHPNARLTIAGDGDERAALEERTQRLGLQDAVTFAGWVTPQEVYELIGKSTAILIPSRCRETFSLVAVEAALMGRPVIATRAGGLEEVVIEGKTGFLVEMEDVDGFTRQIKKIVGDPALAKQMGARALASAHERFTIEANAASYDALYRKVVAAG